VVAASPSHKLLSRIRQHPKQQYCVQRQRAWLNTITDARVFDLVSLLVFNEERGRAEPDRA
jgi:hypothetical protein